MADEMNVLGGIEVHTGPRGFSVVGARTQDGGGSVQFQTDEPRWLNPVQLMRGKTGAAGAKGDPGAGSFRLDESVGVRVFVWELHAPYEVMVYGDTGVRDLGGGTLVRRTGDVVETRGTAPTVGIPAGFKPAAGGAWGGVYTTADPWPTALPGSQTVAPVVPQGLEGYSAAVAGGYPGTPEQWTSDRYRVLPDPGTGTLGQVLTRTREGLAYADLPQIGPEPWRNITLDKTWSVTSHLGNRAQSRTNNGRVDWYGHLTYTGPAVEAGMWSTESVRIGVLDPRDAPEYNMELTCTTYEGGSGAGRPVQARINVTTQGVMSLMSFSEMGKPYKLPLKATTAQIGLTGLSYPARQQ